MVGAVRSLIRHRHLLTALAEREIRDRYIGSALGAAWSLLQPLALVVVMLVVFTGAGARPGAMLGLTAGSMSYAATTVMAFIPWYYTGLVLTGSTSVIRANQSLVSQIEFPLEILPAKVVLSAMAIEVALLLIVLVYGIAYEGAPLQWSLALLPVALVLQFMFLMGLAWMFSTFGVYFRDIEQALPTLVFVNLYLLPIFFLKDAAPAIIARFVAWNPFTPMVEVFRSCITGTAFAAPDSWIVFSVLSLAAFAAGWRLFSALKGGFGDQL